MTFIQMGLGLALGLRLGDIRGSGETGDSKEEEDSQWRHNEIQIITADLLSGLPQRWNQAEPTACNGSS